MSCLPCLPGAPGYNRRAVELGARAALALGLHINQQSIFARKISSIPICRRLIKSLSTINRSLRNGELEIMTAERDDAGHPIEWRPKKIRITRLHLEEDAGKNVHEGLRTWTVIPTSI